MRPEDSLPDAPSELSCPVITTEELLDFGDNRARLARFRQIAVASDFHGLLAIRRERVRRQSDDRNVPRAGIVLQHLSRFPPIDDGNRDVHQDQIRLLRARLGDPFFAVQRLGDRIAEVPQNRGVHDAVVFIVFHQQYRLSIRAHSGPLQGREVLIRRVGGAYHTTAASWRANPAPRHQWAGQRIRQYVKLRPKPAISLPVESPTWAVAGLFELPESALGQFQVMLVVVFDWLELQSRLVDLPSLGLVAVVGIDRG